MAREGCDDRCRSAQRQARAEPHTHGAGRDEAVDEPLRAAEVDLAGTHGRPLAAVSTRVVDVDVEPVLVRDVAEPAEAGPEVAAARPG